MKTMAKWAVAVLAACATQAFAADYPTKPVRFIVAFPPGSATDIVGRLYTQKWTEMWGQTVLADNRPGAGGSIAGAIAAKSNPDGYTLLMHSSGHTVNPSLYARLPYDTIKDFVDIGPLAQQPNVMVTHPSSAYRTVQDVLNAAKSRPGALNFASAGVGSGTHLNLEKLKLMAKVDMNHVPYKGSAEALGDVVGGRVDFYFAPVSTMQGQMQAGKVRAIAVSTIKRSSVLPNVPTIAESGVPGFDFSLWFGIWAPAGVPQPIIARIADSIRAAGNDPVVKGKLSGLGNEPMDMTPAQFAKFVRSEIETGATVLKAAGIKPQ
ncbi:MAG: tripartite tricarboxylate transporter substrate binding protein [Burkholderiales bacterium]|nr:tripartite tricarboxylate transporter substrate binding protein [Burkholderiales bacterium]MCW5603671.1 tripartite tricarboxylate transporter substrate binding protein [Burkholderiales bacterium]